MKNVFDRLQQSPYRSRMRLNAQEKEYLRKKGFSVICDEAVAFVTERIAPAQPKNDGKQTPMHNHPVFVAQHATATCCRKCVEKWHSIKRGKALSVEEIQYLVDLIIKWLDREVTRGVIHPFINHNGS